MMAMNIQIYLVSVVSTNASILRNDPWVGWWDVTK